MKDTAQQNTIGGTTMFHGMPREPFVIDDTKTETRFLPKPVTLTLPDHTQRKFGAGLQEIPVQLLEDPWLKKNGMIEYRGRDPLPPMMMTAMPGTQAHNASIMSSGTYDATLIRDPRITDEHVKATEAVAGMAAENVRVAQENLARAIEILTNAQRSHADALTRYAARDEIAGPDGEGDDTVVGDEAGKPETRKQRTAREKREADFYKALSPDDQKKWDGSTQEERDTWIAA